MSEQRRPGSIGSRTESGIGTLGLLRGTVHLVAHDIGWRSAFEAHADAIRKQTGLPHERVQHVGSTAVPGLVAKPILDIVLGVEGADATDVVAAQLVELGYIDRGVGDGSTGRLLVGERAPEVRTVHIHIVRHGTQDWRDYVDFRDALLADGALRDRYADLKRELASRFGSERKAYTSGKENFVREVLARERDPQPTLRASDPPAPS